MYVYVYVYVYIYIYTYIYLLFTYAGFTVWSLGMKVPGGCKRRLIRLTLPCRSAQSPEIQEAVTSRGTLTILTVLKGVIT